MKGWIVALLAGLVGGFLAGRISRGGLSQDLEDSLAVYRADRRSHKQLTDSLFRVLRVRDQHIIDLEFEGRAASQRANLAIGRAGLQQARAESLRAILAHATNPTDSLRACVQVVTALQSECAELRVANAEFHVKSGIDSLIKDSLKTTVADLRGTVATQQHDLMRADQLVNRLERVARGCRIPILNLHCPSLLAAWGYRSPEVLPKYLGASYPLTSWLNVGLVWDRAKP